VKYRRGPSCPNRVGCMSHVLHYDDSDLSGHLTALSHANCNFKAATVEVQCSGRQCRVSRGNKIRQGNTVLGLRQ
jgi:hypothetical protein